MRRCQTGNPLRTAPARAFNAVAEGPFPDQRRGEPLVTPADGDGARNFTPHTSLFKGLQAHARPTIRPHS
jgi:hypothetical protein